MLKFFELLKRFIPPYKKYVVLNLLFNLLSTVFSLFSFAAIIPVLQILFGLQQSNLAYQPWNWGDGWNQIFSALKNNIFYFLEQIMTTAGPSMTLLYLGLFLIVMTFFKTGTVLLSSYLIHYYQYVPAYARFEKINFTKKILQSSTSDFLPKSAKCDIMSRMTSDVTEIEASLSSVLWK
jgi:ABC-type multidrug transport system fused ATPase/permease subunit